MRDLIVVGAGFWGTATAHLAARAGLDALLLDDGREGAGSRAASGYLARGWWKTREERARMGGALRDLEAAGVPVRWDGADVAQGGANRSYRADWATFRPADVLGLHPRVREDVLLVAPGLVRTTGAELRARAVVIAAGAWTDVLLAASGLPTLGVGSIDGRGVLLRGPSLPRPLLRPTNPYHSWCVRPWDGGLRAGETIETPGDATGRVAALLRDVLPLLPGAVPVGELWGRRPSLPGGPLVQEACPGVVVATGGGRVGASLAWWAGRQALALLFPRKLVP